MDKRPMVLVVDDDPDFAEATKMVLESRDYQVLTALSAEEGLRKAREEKPDLIVLDVIMPLKDGFTVCGQLKSDAALSKIPVIILTSLSQRVGESTVAMSQGLAMEAEDYLDKPVDPQVLLGKVEKLLQKSKL
ncbi:MAG: response regulator [Chloroflexota bacterium]